MRDERIVYEFETGILGATIKCRILWIDSDRYELQLQNVLTDEWIHHTYGIAVNEVVRLAKENEELKKELVMFRQRRRLDG